MNLLAGKAYISSCWYRLRARKPVEVQVRLESADGKTCYASASFTADSAEWQQAELTLTSTADDIGARLVVGCTEDVSLALDMVSLFPTDTFGRRRNGMRADLVQYPCVVIRRSSSPMASSTASSWRLPRKNLNA